MTHNEEAQRKLASLIEDLNCVLVKRDAMLDKSREVGEALMDTYAKAYAETLITELEAH